MEVPKSKSSSLVDWPGGLSIEPVMADQIGHEVKEAWQLPDCTLPKFAERRIANESRCTRKEAERQSRLPISPDIAPQEARSAVRLGSFGGLATNRQVDLQTLRRSPCSNACEIAATVAEPGPEGNSRGDLASVTA